MYNSTIHGPVQVSGEQVNSFIGVQILQPSAHYLLRNRERIARATHWQIKREFLLRAWAVCLN